MKRRFREGDFIETSQGLIFDVKGVVHPPNRIIAFIRYYPSKTGKRKGRESSYEKVYSLSERFAWLKKNFPEYLVYDAVFDEFLCEVPKRDIKRAYLPVEVLERLRKAESLNLLEQMVLEMTCLLKSSSGISWNAIGASGSIMVDLHTHSSDIDLIVYGSKNCRKVYSAIKALFEEPSCPLKPYGLWDLRRLFAFRLKDTFMRFEDFVKVESRKVFQGKFMGKDYFMRFVKNWNEIHEKYGDVRYRNCGYVKIEAVVVDDSEAIFTPCTYKIEDVKIVEGPKLQPITEIASFRGRFCEQARKGEAVVAQGKLEHVTDHRSGEEYFRLLLGNKPTDYMILKH
jgi:predicted nucleotidyltransferase